MRETRSNTTDAERKFGYERTTISRWKSGEEKLQRLSRNLQLEETGSKGKERQKQFKHPLPKFPELESALSAFINEADRRHVPISHDLLKVKARSFMSLLGNNRFRPSTVQWLVGQGAEANWSQPAHNVSGGRLGE